MKKVVEVVLECLSALVMFLRRRSSKRSRKHEKN